MEDRSVLSLPGPAPDQSLRYGADPEQVAEAWPASGAEQWPLVVLIHGGFWRPAYDRAHVRPMAAALREAGWSTVAIEYRREPGRPDHTVADVEAALRALPAAPELTGTHNGTVILAGHSAGGHLALHAAATSSAVAGVLALAPVADLGMAHRLRLGDGAVADFLGQAPDQRPDLDPVRLTMHGWPVVIVHGVDDERVPIELAHSYVEVHPAARLVPIEDAGHFELIDPRSHAWPLVLDELHGLSS